MWTYNCPLLVHKKKKKNSGPLLKTGPKGSHGELLDMDWLKDRIVNYGLSYGP